MKYIKIRKNYIGVMLLLAACFLLAFPVNAQAKPKLSKTNLKVAKGVTRKLKVKGTDAKVTWKSSNKKVATVTNQGKVTGKKTGTATIKAKVGGTTLKCKVKVTNPKLNKTNITLYSAYFNYETFKSKGEKCQLKVKGTDSKVTWKSNNKKIATVTNKGLVKAKLVSYETATIQAVVDGKTLKCNVKVYLNKEDEKWDKIGKKVEAYVKSKGGVVCNNFDEVKASKYNTSLLSLYSTFMEFLHEEAWYHEMPSLIKVDEKRTVDGNVKWICRDFDSFKAEAEEFFERNVKCGVYIYRHGKLSNTETCEYEYSYYFWRYLNND